MVLKHVDGHSKTIAVRCGSSSNLGGHLDVAKPWLWSAASSLTLMLGWRVTFLACKPTQQRQSGADPLDLQFRAQSSAKTWKAVLSEVGGAGAPASVRRSKARRLSQRSRVGVGVEAGVSTWERENALNQRAVLATADAMSSVAARSFGVSASVMRPTSPYLNAPPLAHSTTSPMPCFLVVATRRAAVRNSFRS